MTLASLLLNPAKTKQSRNYDIINEFDLFVSYFDLQFKEVSQLKEF